MDEYPAHYIAHNIPLILLSGLGTPDPNAVDEIEQQYSLLQDGGMKFSSEIPDVTGKTAEALLDCFQDFDARDAPWNNRPGPGKFGSMGFTHRCVGRSFTFPPHKDQSQSSMSESTASGSSRPSLRGSHSPISPLSPNSPLYPDGTLTPLWFTKHQLLLPAALAVFFSFTQDSNRITLEDNRIKNEINRLKTEIVASGYKTRLTVIIVSESDIVDPTAAERIANLRRSTALDAKTLFYLPGYTTAVELRAFIGNVLSTLQPACIEYYRDLSKHARRKRNRTTNPTPAATPPSGSQLLSSPGWTIRYETKLGAFAEFRQEMDAAGRSYEVAHETLLDGTVFDAMDFQSIRFQESRILADVLAFRIIRCLLWTGQTTSAVQSWLNHRSRIHDLIQRKSAAGSSYGWHAWDARWAKVMGELVTKVDVPVFHIQQEVRSPGSLSPEYPVTFVRPEKNLANETRLNPWESLHHPGYWLGRSAAATRVRRSLAHALSVESATTPQETDGASDQPSPQQYDTFLCPPPAEESQFDHSSALIGTLEASDHEFLARAQPRASEITRLNIGVEYMQSERWTEATKVLRPLWQTLTWRQSQWWDLVGEASSAILKCAVQVEDWEMYLAAQWELLSRRIPDKSDQVFDFHSCLDKLELLRKPHVSINSENVAPTFTAQFCFLTERGNAGVSAPAQLVITCLTHPNVAPITLSELEVAVEGNLKRFALSHDATVEPKASDADGTELYEIPTLDISGTTQKTNLRFSSGQSKTFSFRIIPREAGEVKVSSVALSVSGTMFEFDVTIPLREPVVPPVWWETTNSSIIRKPLMLSRACALTVLPKPPKLKLEVLQFQQTCYSDEVVELPISFDNAEDDTANVKLTVSLTNDGESVPMLHLGEMPSPVDTSIVRGQTSRLEDHKVGELIPGKTAQQLVSFRAVPGIAELALVVRADYHLLCDPETPVSVTLKEKLSFINPLEVNCTFHPQLDTQPWPSYFIVGDGSSTNEKGLRQKWTMSAKIASFALEPIAIESATLEVIHAKYGVDCKVESAANESKATTPIQPNDTIEQTFGLEVQKLTVDDRRSALVSFQLNIEWRREHNTTKKSTTTSLLVPSLTIPFGEPRVLCLAKPSKEHLTMMHLTYVLENPSTHLLTFSVTMETSDEFAFSGPKAKLLQLVPLSRTEIKFNIMPFEHGVWIHPYLRVTDTGFGQELKILAAGGCRNEKKAVAIWVDAQESEA